MHHEHLIWNAYRRVPVSFMPRPWQQWLLDRGSLTKRLIDASNGHFEVRVVEQKVQLPSLSERVVLQLAMQKRALVREVELLCYGEVWVRARSVIPLATLTGAERQLKYLKNKPLGAFLFASPAMRRGHLEVSRASRLGKTSYARRSIFWLHGKPLLVSEYFCEPVIRMTKI